VFDGAHGIGAPKLQMLAPKLAGYLHMSIRNGVEVGDHNCFGTFKLFMSC
jgi:hypothetical protein